MNGALLISYFLASAHKDEKQPIENPEEIEAAKTILQKILKDEAERTAFRLQLIREVGVKAVAEMEKHVDHFYEETKHSIENEYHFFQESLKALQSHVGKKIEKGEYLENRLLLADNEASRVSEDEVVFKPNVLSPINPFEVKHTEDVSIQPNGDFLQDLQTMANEFHKESPHGLIDQKHFHALISKLWENRADHLTEAYTVPRVANRPPHWRETLLVDWRRFIASTALIHLNADPSKVLESLRSLALEMGKSTLVGLTLPAEDVRKVLVAQGDQADEIHELSRLFLSMFENEDGSMQVDDLVILLARTGASSPLEGLLRIIVALNSSSQTTPSAETFERISEYLNNEEQEKTLEEDFEVSIEIFQKILQYAQKIVGASTKGFLGDKTPQEMELEEVYRDLGPHETPTIAILCQQPKFRRLLSWTAPFFCFPNL